MVIFNCLWTKCSLICQNSSGYCSLRRENILCKLCRELSEERVWNWVKSAKDNIGQGPQIIGSWSLELKIPRYLVWIPKNPFEIPFEIGSNLPPILLDREFCKVHIGNSPRPTTLSDSQLANLLTFEHLQYIHCVHFVQKGFVLTNLNPWINFARFFSRLTTVFLFCELCEQEKQETLPLGLSTALPARGKFVEKQLTHI